MKNYSVAKYLDNNGYHNAWYTWNNYIIDIDTRANSFILYAEKYLTEYDFIIEDDNDPNWNEQGVMVENDSKRTYHLYKLNYRQGITIQKGNATSCMVKYSENGEAKPGQISYRYIRIKPQENIPEDESKSALESDFLVVATAEPTWYNFLYDYDTGMLYAKKVQGLPESNSVTFWFKNYSPRWTTRTPHRYNGNNTIDDIIAKKEGDDTIKYKISIDEPVDYYLTYEHDTCIESFYSNNKGTLYNDSLGRTVFVIYEDNKEDESTYNMKNDIYINFI